MFRIDMLEGRDQSVALLYRDIKRIMKKNGDWAHYLKQKNYLEQRAELKAHIESVTVEGQVCVTEWGRDCDHCESYSERNEKAPTVIAFQRREQLMYEWAEGPCSLSISEPVDEPEHYSRDHIMEAYENGHPHCVAL